MLDVPLLSAAGCSICIIYQKQVENQLGSGFAASSCPHKIQRHDNVPLHVAAAGKSAKIGFSVTMAPPCCLSLEFVYLEVRQTKCLLCLTCKEFRKSKVLPGHEMGVLIAIGLGAISTAIPLLLLQVRSLRKGTPLGSLRFRFLLLWLTIKSTIQPFRLLDGSGCLCCLMLIDVFNAVLEETDIKKPAIDSPPALVLLGMLDAIWDGRHLVRYALIMTPAAVLIVLML
jgi:hypothetical protein